MEQVNQKIYRILSPEGKEVGPPPNLPAERLVQAYRWLLYGRAFSDRMVALQRQGRMGTFAPLNGQEAASVGMVLPLEPGDWLVASYRETLAYMVRGVPPMAIMKQWGGEIADDYRYETHCLPFQIVIGTQMLHAVGVAQAIQYRQEPHVVVAGCGDGATSQGDFNEALNFAGVFKAPVVFVVQNNGWAISTPRARQTAASTFAQRGPGFGIPGRLVDGNDVLAVYQAVTEAVDQAKAGHGPTLIEAVTYRLGAHTTADDPTKYRPQTECEQWAARDPLPRFRTWLMNRHVLTEPDERQMREEIQAELDAVVSAYEALPPQKPEQLFELTYVDLPRSLQYQQKALLHELRPRTPPSPLDFRPRQDERARDLQLAA